MRERIFYGGGFPSFRGLGGGFEGFWRQIRLQHVKISQGSSFESIPLDWRRFHKGQNVQKNLFSLSVHGVNRALEKGKQRGWRGFRNFFRKCWPLNVGFPAVWSRKCWFRKLRGVCRKKIHLVAPLKTSVVTSYDQKKQNCSRLLTPRVLKFERNVCLGFLWCFLVFLGNV